VELEGGMRRRGEEEEEKRIQTQKAMSNERRKKI